MRSRLAPLAGDATQAPTRYVRANSPWTQTLAAQRAGRQDRLPRPLPASRRPIIVEEEHQLRWLHRDVEKVQDVDHVRLTGRPKASSPAAASGYPPSAGSHKISPAAALEGLPMRPPNEATRLLVALVNTSRRRPYRPLASATSGGGCQGPRDRTVALRWLTGSCPRGLSVGIPRRPPAMLTNTSCRLAEGDPAASRGRIVTRLLFQTRGPPPSVGSIAAPAADQIGKVAEW